MMTSKWFGKVAMTLAVSALWMGSAFAGSVSKDFNVSGWSCDSCAKKTIAEVKKVEGVTEATADADKGILTVTFDDAKVKDDAISAAIKKAGYSCSLKEKADKKS